MEIFIAMRLSFFISLILSILLTMGTATAQSHSKLHDVQQTIENLACSDVVSQAVISFCAITGDGQKIVDINSSDMLVPASNMKLISTGTALHKLGPDYKFQTSITHDGEICNGTLNGNLYIIGGGDPTLGSINTIATPINTTFSQWTAMLKKAGITHINGKIIGDGKYFDGAMEEPTWLMEDVGTYYGAGTSGLMFYENMQSFKVSAGNFIGASINISPSYPVAPWMEFRYNCTTGEKGSGDQLYMFTNELAPIAEIRGTFGVDRKAKRLDSSNKFPEYTCAHYFKEYLNSQGITCSEGVGDFKLDNSWTPAGEMKELGRTYSPELKRIVFETNHISNNVFAETMLRTLGRELTGSASYDSSYVAIKNVLEDLGVDTSFGVRIKDGSGLSRQNYISSDFLCRFLFKMMDSPHFEAFVESLPSPGGNGTLLYNMKKTPADIKSRIKAKCGSMNGVRCYSGYIIPTDGAKEDVIIFALLVNNCTSPSWEVRNLLDSIMAKLAELN